jgi:large conductance mechanosensitive channel
MFKEFKAFAMRGNVLDLAVGVIIGAAFGAIVNSLVNDIIMPPIGKLMGGMDFKDLFFPLDGKAYESLAIAKMAGAPVIAYGSFLNTIINFLIISFSIFLLIRQVNKLTAPPPATAPSTRDCPYCGMSIPLKATKCGHCTSALK